MFSFRKNHGDNLKNKITSPIDYRYKLHFIQESCYQHLVGDELAARNYCGLSEMFNTQSDRLCFVNKIFLTLKLNKKVQHRLAGI